MSYVNYYPKTRKIKKDPPEKIFSRNSLKINYEFFYNNLIFFYRLNTKSNIIIKNLYSIFCNSVRKFFTIYLDF